MNLLAQFVPMNVQCMVPLKHLEMTEKADEYVISYICLALYVFVDDDLALTSAALVVFQTSRVPVAHVAPIDASI